MVVCGHGDVTEYCENHDMVICDKYEGKLCNYRGAVPVIVTDSIRSESDYFAIKLKMLKHGIEVISTQYSDEPIKGIIGRVVEDTRKRRVGGREHFGFVRIQGVSVENPAMIAVARKIIELRDAGLTMKAITEHPEVYRPDGKKVSISTVQTVLNNRILYESERE